MTGGGKAPRGGVATAPSASSPRQAVPGTPQTEELFRSLPRAGKLKVEGEMKPQRRRAVVLAKASWYSVLARSIHWLFNILRMMLRSTWDRLARRNAPKYFGIRLRKLFEEMGGTAIKVGQQLSVRVDLFPLEVCHELATLRDKVPPFPTEEAIAIIEQALGAKRGLSRVPLHEVFQAFDPSPIGAASIACVYQGVLRTGERVAVKVRRPKVQKSFGEDLKVLDIVTKCLEMLSLVRPGFFKNLRSELRSMLQQELDFTQEARFQRLFRHYAKKDKLDWLTAPKIYSQYCTQEVMVSEFVEGVWCDEILRAHEVGDPAALSQLADMGITPKKVGKRLMQYSFWSRFEALFFHSDPHPGNILVQPGCKIVFVDFGSCGTTSRKSRMTQLMMIERMSYNDVSGTVDAAVATLEPLPYIDVYELKKDVEAHFWDWLFAFRDKKAEWWERTTAGIWFALLDITRRRHIPVGLETLRLARSLLLIDTLCFELDPQMVSPDEFQKYMRKAARRGARRVIKRAQRTPISSFFDTVIWQTDDLVTRGRYLAWQAERFIDSVPNEFALGISKGMYMLHSVLRILLDAGVIAGLVVGLHALYKQDFPEWSDFFHIFREHPFVLLLFTIPVWIHVRRIWYRLTDLDVPRSRGPRD